LDGSPWMVQVLSTTNAFFPPARSRGMDLIAFHLESVPDKLPDWDYGYVMNGEVPRQKFEF